jgi:2-(3-amino-3-carboxypropyl)histidine synthase
MKTMFIEARSRVGIIPDNKQLKRLPKRLALATTVQHAHKIRDLKRHLERNDKKVVLLKGKHSRYAGQVLGCDFSVDKKIMKNTDAILYVGTGSFHPIELAMKSGKEVFVFNPVNKTLNKINIKDINKIKKRKKGALIKFLSSKEIGILISTKPGQYHMKRARELEKKYKNKNFHYLFFDTLDFNDLENFPFIQCFVNAACPRMIDDCGRTSKPMINIEDVVTL